MLTHSREKPHKCNLCEKQFTQATNLKQHTTLNKQQTTHNTQQQTTNNIHPIRNNNNRTTIPIRSNQHSNCNTNNISTGTTSALAACNKRGQKSLPSCHIAPLCRRQPRGGTGLGWHWHCPWVAATSTAPADGQTTNKHQTTHNNNQTTSNTHQSTNITQPTTHTNQHKQHGPSVSSLVH